MSVYRSCSIRTLQQNLSVDHIENLRRSSFSPFNLALLCYAIKLAGEDYELAIKQEKRYQYMSLLTQKHKHDVVVTCFRVTKAGIRLTCTLRDSWGLALKHSAGTLTAPSCFTNIASQSLVAPCCITMTLRNSLFSEHDMHTWDGTTRTSTVLRTHEKVSVFFTGMHHFAH